MTLTHSSTQLTLQSPSPFLLVSVLSSLYCCRCSTVSVNSSRMVGGGGQEKEELLEIESQGKLRKPFCVQVHVDLVSLLCLVLITLTATSLCVFLSNPAPIPYVSAEKDQPAGPMPLVLWHGMGDTAVGIKFGLRFISKEIPGLYVKSLQFGSNPAKDMENGYFLNVNEQVETACSMIRRDEKLENGFNAIGVSQGGQFMRALVQRCTGIKMINLISLGGQHQGIFGIPKCSAKKSWCEIIDKLLTHAAYSSWVQKFLVQAEYWHDPFNEASYVENSVFLADINNERTLNLTYKENLLKLHNLVLVKFNGDTIVQPKDSEWFGFYKNETDKETYGMEDSSLYQEDKIGLRTLKESGRLHLVSVPGEHLEFSKDWFIETILKPFLLPVDNSKLIMRKYEFYS